MPQLPTLAHPSAAAILLLATGWLLAPMAACQVVISELMAFPVQVRPDRRSDAHDWVELHNLTDASVSLAGWYLTDDVEAQPTRWRFPEGTRLAGRGFLILHCTGHDRQDPPHTNFALGRKQGTVALVEPDGVTVAHRVDYGRQHRDVSFGFTQESVEEELLPEGAIGRAFVPHAVTPGWTGIEFDDSKWRRGLSGFGFDFKPDRPYQSFIRTDISGLLRHRATSALLRFSFELEDPSGIDALRIEMRYEEGFIAYLGGVELLRENVPDDADWRSEAVHRRAMQDVTQPEKTTLGGVKERSLLRPGRNVLGIQGFLIGRATRDFLVLPRLIGIRLGALDTSTSLYLTQPTPGAPNTRGGAHGVTKRPRIRAVADPESKTTTVHLEGADPAAAIHYTLDGTLPTRASPRYEGPIQLEPGRRLAALAVAPDSLPSAPVFEQSPLLDPSLLEDSSNLPLMVVETFGEAIGPGNLSRAHLRVYDVGVDGRCSLDRAPSFTGPAGIRTRGSSTLHRPKKAYALELWEKRDADLDASLLGMPADSDWILYGAYNFDKSLMRNALMYELSNRIGRYAPRTRFVEVFVNDEGGPTTAEHYVGVYSLVEKVKRGRHRVDLGKKSDGPGPGYILKIDRPDPGDLGFVAGGEKELRHVHPGEKAIRPADAAWIRRYLDDFGGALGMDGDEQGDYARFIDVDSFVDFHLLNELAKNPDAYKLSTYMHLPRGGKLVMGPIWDYDRALRTNDDESWVGSKANPREWSDPYRRAWWGKLLDDRAFKARYRSRWLELRSGPLATSQIFAVIDRYADELREAQARNFARWQILGDEPWEEVKIPELRAWITQRLEWLDNELFPAPSILPLPREIPLKLPQEIRLEPPAGFAAGETHFTLDGTDPRGEDGGPSPSAQPYAEPFTVEGDTAVRARVRLGDDLWSALRESFFTEKPMTLCVTEIMYEPSDGSEHEFLELHNHGEEPLDFDGVHFERGVGFAFDGMTMAPGEHAVIVRDQAAFRTRYPDEGIRVLGQYERKLDDHDVLHLVGSLGQTIFRIEYDDDWYPTTDGKGPSLTLNDPRPAQDEWSEKESWHPSTNPMGTPGRSEQDE